MYLSRLILNPKSFQVRRDLSDCHNMHRTVLKGFPDMGNPGEDARKHYGVLHRVDIHPRNGEIMLLVQSSVKPDWSQLPINYLSTKLGIENPASKCVDEQYAGIRTSEILRFRLRANPTKKIGTSRKVDLAAGKPKCNGRRVIVGDEKEQIEWLIRKGTLCGFEILSSRLLNEVPDVQTREDGKTTSKANLKGTQSASDAQSKNKLSFASVTYEGYLKVIDRDKFLTSIKSGIGSGKAYGFGLLSIAPVR